MRIAIIGAGFAGLSSAIYLKKLSQVSVSIDLFEASDYVGGRAREVVMGKSRHDNGQHIMIGAYRTCLDLMSIVGIDQTKVFKRIPLFLSGPGSFFLRAPFFLPAPLNLLWAMLSAKGISVVEKIQLIKFSFVMKKLDFTLAQDETVLSLLTRFRQSQRIQSVFWAPLCVAALNTPYEQASANVFLRILKDGLMTHRDASDLLIPSVGLGEFFPERANVWLEQKGVRLFFRHRVRSVINADTGGFELVFYRGIKGQESLKYDAIVIAATPKVGADLALPLAHDRQKKDLLRSVKDWHWQPITTVYLRYPAEVSLPHPMMGLSGIAHWIFDHGTLKGKPGQFSVVISAEGMHRSLDKKALVAEVHRSLLEQLDCAFGEAPLSSTVITEKQATFSCYPDLERPCHQVCDDVYLAGDYVYSGYPSVLEGAARSGEWVARSILGHRHD